MNPPQFALPGRVSAGVSGGARCGVPGCDRAHYGRGWCQPHYRRWKRTGDVGEDVPIRAKDGPHYITVHKRLRDQRGPASDHYCVDCGRPATEWSYIHHNDPEAKVSSRGLRYSADLRRYAPRCSRCHARFDGVADRLRARRHTPGGAR